VKFSVEIDDNEIVKILAKRFQEQDNEAEPIEALHAEVSAILADVDWRFSIGCSH
jgi:HD superfamily phosphohydrolase YqeK